MVAFSGLFFCRIGETKTEHKRTVFSPEFNCVVVHLCRPWDARQDSSRASWSWRWRCVFEEGSAFPPMISPPFLKTARIVEFRQITKKTPFFAFLPNLSLRSKILALFQKIAKNFAWFAILQRYRFIVLFASVPVFWLWVFWGEKYSILARESNGSHDEWFLSTRRRSWTRQH